MIGRLVPGSAKAQSWSLNPIVELHWRDWGDDSVVLEARSGQLFQFDALSAAVMACIEEKPQPVGQVLQALSADLGVSGGVEFRETVLAIVEEFRRLGWLEPIIDR